MCRKFPILLLLIASGYYSSTAHAQVTSDAKQPQGTIQNQTTTPNSVPSVISASLQPDAEAKKLYQQGLDQTDAGQLPEALQSLQQALTLEPDYADAYAAIGRVYFKMRQWQKAIDYLNRAADLHAKQKAEHDAIYEKLKKSDSQSGRSLTRTSTSMDQRDSVTPTELKSPQSNGNSNPTKPLANEQQQTSTKSIEKPNNTRQADLAPLKPPETTRSSLAPPTKPTANNTNTTTRNPTVNSPNPPKTQPTGDVKKTATPTDSEANALKLKPNNDGGAPPWNSDDDITTTTQGQSPVSVQVGMNLKPDANSNAVPTASDDNALTKIYRVGPNDVLDIQINDTQSPKSTLFTITSSGFLEHPMLAEPLSVSGLTTQEIEQQIENDLKRRALVEDPKVAVGVRDFASHSILISGLVKDSGTKFLRREAIPLYVVVADAQPLPEAASVTVVRNEPHQIFEIELAQATEMNFMVRSGDVITLHPSVTQFIYIGGDVKSPGEKTFRRGLTLMQAIISAGGITPKTKFSEITRDDGRGFLVGTRVNLKDIQAGKAVDPVLKPGDRIMILR